ncbi:MAG: polyprenyl synthetase family protein [Candidatus Bathyarchaeia archaeon]
MRKNAKNKKSIKLAEQVAAILTKRGEEAQKRAREIILNEKFGCETIRKAIHFSMQEWHKIKHPGFLSIACETVGGDSEIANEVGASLLFLLSSAHIHDDIIDQSKSKEGKPTVYSKFGRDIALLTGDALLFEGLMLLHKICEKLPVHKKEVILHIIKSAFFEVCCGEANEVILRHEHAFSPEKCLDNLRKRAAMAEATMRIGGIIGDGSDEEIEILGHYGRTLGILAAIREEFIDIYDPEELMNRYRNELPPLPILYALKDEKKKNKINSMIQKKHISQEDASALVKLILNSEEVRKLKKKMQSLIENELKLLKPLKINRKTLKLILYSMMEDL